MIYNKPAVSFNKVHPNHRFDLLNTYRSKGNKLERDDVKAYTPNQQEVLLNVTNEKELVDHLGMGDEVAKEARGESVPELYVLPGGKAKKTA